MNRFEDGEGACRDSDGRLAAPRLRKFAIEALLGILGAALILGALTIAYIRASPSASLNYKLSVEIDDNGVPRRGEGVVRAVFQAQPILIGQTPPWTIGPVGEAFPVDLGSKGMFFVLVSRDPGRKPSVDAGSKGALYSYFHFRNTDAPTEAVLASFVALAESHSAVDVRPEQLPMLVRFRDVNDPKSVEIVDADHLDQSFGPGVKIKAVRAEITNEPVTTDLGNRLPWLRNGAYGTRIFEAKGEPIYQISPVRMITYGDFATGSFWRGR